MHKAFYASGFLYHPPTQQILLQQRKTKTEGPVAYAMIGGINRPAEKADKTFQRHIHKLLNLRIKPALVHQVYEYHHKEMNKHHIVMYAEVTEIEKISNKNCTWFTFKQIMKLPLSEQAKHDITVGQRVIDSRKRKSLGQQTLE